jgi:hypothetical protein
MQPTFDRSPESRGVPAPHAQPCHVVPESRRHGMCCYGGCMTRRSARAITSPLLGPARACWGVPRRSVQRAGRRGRRRDCPPTAKRPSLRGGRWTTPPRRPGSYWYEEHNCPLMFTDRDWASVVQVTNGAATLVGRRVVCGSTCEQGLERYGRPGARHPARADRSVPRRRHRGARRRRRAHAVSAARTGLRRQLRHRLPRGALGSTACSTETRPPTRSARHEHHQGKADDDP